MRTLVFLALLLSALPLWANSLICKEKFEGKINTFEFEVFSGGTETSGKVVLDGEIIWINQAPVSQGYEPNITFDTPGDTYVLTFNNDMFNNPRTFYSQKITSYFGDERTIRCMMNN